VNKILKNDMKVFITGATGYIGFNVAKALRRAGNDVFGLTRSREKAFLLHQHEITPVIGDMSDPASYLSIAENCSVLIHAAMDYENDAAELDKETVKNLLTISKKSTRPKIFLYTSGCWIHGDTGGKLVDETTPLSPASMVAWRIEVEQMVLNANNVKGIVVRPGCVYGKRGGLTGMWFDAISRNDDLKISGDGSNHWTLVHVDDLANAYVRLAGSGLTSEVFEISDHSRESVRDMVKAVADTAGYEKDLIYLTQDDAVKEFGGMAESLALDQHVDGSKIMRLLGWRPRFNSFIDHVDIFYNAWKAYQNQSVGQIAF
jgi:nucleoside-diphosphate-sugar epimerase